MMNTIKYYYYSLLFDIQDFIFGKEEEEGIPETQDDTYAGGQCFYDPATGKKSCE